MSRRENGLLVGLLLFVILLIALPYVLLLLAGWPGAVSVDEAMFRLGTIGPIAGSPPRLGLSPRMIRWELLLAGLGLGIGLGLALVFLGKGAVKQDMPANTRFRLLALLGAVSLVTYGLNFLLPFPLFRYYSVQLGGMGLIAVRDASIALSLTAATVTLFLLSGLAYTLCRGKDDRRLWAIVLAGGLLFAVIAVFMFPISSLDIYDYIARGRITGIHCGNPYVRPSGDYSFDPFMGYAAWQEATSPYGPLWETLGGVLARLAGNRLLPNLLAFKGLALMGYIVSVPLIAAILRRTAPERALAGTLLFAWNPLVMFEAMANAHNDALVVALLLGAFWILSWHLDRTGDAGPPLPDERFWKRVRGGVALILVGAAVLVKLIPLLFLPPFLLFLLADEKGWWRRIGVGLLLLAPVLLLAIEYYRIFWQWPEVFNTVLRQATMFRMSIPSATKEALQQYVGEARAQVLVRPFLAVFALAYLIVLGRAAHALKMLPQQGFLATVSRFLFGRGHVEGRRSWDVLTNACLAIFVLYLLVGNFWFWPWYLILPIALLALAGDERLFLPLLLAACAGEVSHVGWNFVWYWWGVSWETLYRMDMLIVFFMVVPALVVYAINLRRK
jgi:hypothetical protein